MNATQGLIDWLQGFEPFAKYQPARGMFDETESDAQTRFLSIILDGGRNPGPIEDYQNVMLVWTGQRDAASVEGGLIDPEDDARAFQSYARENYKKSCFARVKFIGGIIGPKFTEQGRPCYMMNLELIY